MPTDLRSSGLPTRPSGGCSRTMPETHFAQLLSTRRRQLRLSIPQAAKVLRMREAVLEAFEHGDFERLPALGYAQAMVASYARYLGLDPLEITDLYEREHEQYVREVTGHDTVGLARLSDEPSSRGPASAASVARSTRGSGAGIPTPRSSRTGSLYLESSRGPSTSSTRDYHDEDYDRRYGRNQERHRYTTRLPPEEPTHARHGRHAAAARRLDSDEDARRDARERRLSNTGDITTRRVSTGQYRDDMRFDDGARPYRPSSTRAGRQASRTSVPLERPNVRRRRPPTADRDPRARTRHREQPQPQGIAGALREFASDTRRVMLAFGLGLAVVLAIILIVSIRSCAGASNDSKQVSVVTAATTSATTSATTVSAAEQQALSDAAERAAASSAAAASQETVVTVTVARGATTWVEITNDGVQQRAEQTSGEWSEHYTVTQSIDIKVGDPNVVSVTKNGAAVQFSNKTAGIASVTIEGTPASSTAATSAQ